MIELRLKNGEDVLLTPIRKDNNQYELVDFKNSVCMIFEIINSTIKVIDYKKVDNTQLDLMERLDTLVVSILESEQSGVENNENDDKFDITPYNPDCIKVHQKQFSIKFIEEMISTGDIDFTPDFQRHFVWNSVQKSKLIESLLLRIPLPLFYFSEDEEGRLTIVDGLQRLTTIKEFMNNEFPLRHLEYLDEGVKDRYYKSDLKEGKIGIDPKYYRWFNMTQFAVNVIDPTSPFQVKYDIFRRINTGGKPLKNQEIRNCLSSRSLRKLLVEMTKLPEFLSATNRSVKSNRMEDQEIALRFLAFYDAYKKDSTLTTSYSGYMESFLDETTNIYNKIDEIKHSHIIDIFRNSLLNAEYLFGNKYAYRKIRKEHIGDNCRMQLLNKALFIAWSVLLADIPNSEIKEHFPEKYLLPIFAEELENDKKLMYYLSYGTNGKSNLEYIFNTIYNIINIKLNYNEI